MVIKFGDVLENKTFRYLSPCLKGHGDIFINKFQIDVFKLVYGISDTLLEGSDEVENRRPIFILCDRAVNTAKFNSFLEWVKYKDFYITDYTYDASNPRLHMLVLEVPKDYFNAYDKFTLGLYSEMYTKEQLEVLFKNKQSEAFKVLSKDSSLREAFISKVEEEFGTVINDDSLSDSELDFPYTLNKNNEIFNCC